MERIVAIVNAQGVLNDVVDSNIEILTEEGYVDFALYLLISTPIAHPVYSHSFIPLYLLVSSFLIRRKSS
jgi:hypothetical protein